jgi:hypothetical protein
VRNACGATFTETCASAMHGGLASVWRVHHPVTGTGPPGRRPGLHHQFRLLSGGAPVCGSSSRFTSFHEYRTRTRRSGSTFEIYIRSQSQLLAHAGSSRGALRRPASRVIELEASGVSGSCPRLKHPQKNNAAGTYLERGRRETLPAESTRRQVDEEHVSECKQARWESPLSATLAKLLEPQKSRIVATMQKQSAVA